ncbi:adenylate kinase family protein [Candidatus Similichlamydia epinepheli]|uniref:adenylate kinase family protein n=1 Tax=Candidatus Similichlamydia epinepheli TaxID=1903953 RepID=UPI000D380927|nr:nucleoside monophosphate kinase [Candidatus Similichlamydia epinepheli]
MPKCDIRSILLLGPPGSGKGTLGLALSRVMSIPHISTGDLVRAAPASSPLGQARVRLSDFGSFISDEMIFATIRDYIQGLLFTFQLEHGGWVILDGIPRTSEQVDLISSLIEVSVTLQLYTSSKEVLFERITKRAKLHGRADDIDPEIIRKRIAIYENNVDAIASKLDSSRIFKIDATRSILHVVSDSLSVLAPFLGS